VQCPLQTSPITQLPVATSTPQCHILPIHYVALSDPPQNKTCPFPLGDAHPPEKKQRPSQNTTPNSIICIHRLNFYCCCLCTINWPNSPYLSIITDARTMCKQRHTKFSCKLTQSSPIGQLNHATSNNVQCIIFAANA